MLLRHKRRPDLSIWWIAAALTGLNALKRVTIDDTAFLYYARQIASHATDPYGFEIFWYDTLTPAMELLAPAGLPYWLGAGIALLGEHPAVLKLWLFPYALLLVWAMRDLIRRFAPAGGTALLLICSLSPSIVPAFNLMLDIPALSLSLGALALFIRACERAQLSTALLAGLLVGLAMQTKYNSVAQAGALVIYGLLARQFRLTAVAAGLAGGVFLGWEAWLVHRYGESHILHHYMLAPQAAWINTPTTWAIGWTALFGALAWPPALLGLSTLRQSKVLLAVGMMLATLPLVVVAMLEPRTTPTAIRPIRLGEGDLALDAFFAAGCVVVLVVLIPIVSGLKRRQSGWERGTLFLLIWFAIELLACFFVSPFHAARRLIGPIFVATLVAAHCGLPREKAPHALRWVALYSVCLGLLFGVTDLADSRARHEAQGLIARELERLGHDVTRERVWFTGHWGFQFYSEERGYLPLIAGYADLAEGDFILAARDVSTQALPKIAVSKRLGRAVTRSPLPFSTNPSFYYGAVPIRRQPKVQMRVRIHRALESGVVPALPPS